MKMFRSLVGLIVLFTSLSVFAGTVKQLSTLNYTFTVGANAVLVSGVPSGVNYSTPAWSSPVAGTLFASTAEIRDFRGGTITVTNIQKTHQGNWYVYWTDVAGNTYYRWINVNVSSNAIVPDLTLTGTLSTTGTGKVADLYFTISGTQPTAITIGVRGSGSLATGVANPQIQLLNSSGKSVGTCYVMDKSAHDSAYRMFWFQAFSLTPSGCPIAAGDSILVANVSPGTYTIVVSSKSGKAGDFRLDMADFLPTDQIANP